MRSGFSKHVYPHYLLLVGMFVITHFLKAGHRWIYMKAEGEKSQGSRMHFDALLTQLLNTGYQMDIN